jgi:hypothetical protein
MITKSLQGEGIRRVFVPMDTPCCSRLWRCSGLWWPAGLSQLCRPSRRCRGPARRWPTWSAALPAPDLCGGQPSHWRPLPRCCRSALGSCRSRGAGRGLGPLALATGAIVSLLAASSALIQPRAGRARDQGRIGDRTGLATGLILTATGCAAVLIPGIAGLLAAAVLIGIGVGVITPIGFAHLAATTPSERLGQTLGAAEVGRELGDAGGPLLVGAIATATTLTPALLILAALLSATAAIVAAPATRRAGQLVDGGPRRGGVNRAMGVAGRDERIVRLPGLITQAATRGVEVLGRDIDQSAAIVAALLADFDVVGVHHDERDPRRLEPATRRHVLVARTLGSHVATAASPRHPQASAAARTRRRTMDQCGMGAGI